MNTIICDDSKKFGPMASEWCQEKINSVGARSIFIPAGNTPIPLYEVWRATKPQFLQGIDLLQIDEVLTGSQRGVFKKFFTDHLPEYKKQMKFIDRADQGADLGILGLGLNGHVAFHEPGLPGDFFSGCVRLNEVTCKYLDLAPGTWGLTYGAGAFMKCKSILIMVNGFSKREILTRLLNGDPSVPAAALLKHRDLTILADRDAWPVTRPTNGCRFEANGAA